MNECIQMVGIALTALFLLFHSVILYRVVKSLCRIWNDMSIELFELRKATMSSTGSLANRDLVEIPFKGAGGK